MFAIRTKKVASTLGVALVLTVLVGSTLVPIAGRAHVDSSQLTDPCGSCHVGHGAKGEPMLEKSEEAFCYQCHGSSDERTEMILAGKMRPGTELADMRREFNKTYTHPVKLSGEHSPVERLPEFAGSLASHAECVDCHNPHQRLSGSDLVKVKGYSLSGQYLPEITHEYEICLKCHTDHLGAKGSGRSLVKAFARTSRSQHPVTTTSIGIDSPSLMDKASRGELLNCSDCHWSGDPDGPRGPHGSYNEFMLSGNYDRDVFAVESAYAFEFCYSCHDRRSILGNESFPLHREHIEGDRLRGINGTSCYTCHASHGAPDNLHLIMFNPLGVDATDSGRPISYYDKGQYSGTCVLKCHNYNHDSGSY